VWPGIGDSLPDACKERKESSDKNSAPPPSQPVQLKTETRMSPTISETIIKAQTGSVSQQPSTAQHSYQFDMNYDGGGLANETHVGRRVYQAQ